MAGADPLYVFVAVAAGLAGLAMAWPGLRNREKPGATGFLVVVVSGSIYALASAVGAVLADPWGLFALQNLTVLGGGGLGVGWFLLTGEYTERVEPTRSALALGGAYLLAIQALAWSSPIHGLFYDPLAAFSATFADNVRILFWGHATVAYGLIAIGTGFLLVDVVRSTEVRRRQGVALALAPLPGLVASLVSNLGLTPVDLTPVAYPLALGFLAWALFHADFLDVVPVGRTTVLESMDDPVVTLDADDRVVDSNAAARALVDYHSGWEGTPVEEFLEPIPRLAEAIGGAAPAEGELSVDVDGTERVFDLTVSRLAGASADGPVRGRVVVVRDVTETANQRRRIERQNERLERLADVIAHDMRGPVSTGRKTLTLLRTELEDPDAVVEQSLANLEAVTERLDGFVEHLPRLARESTRVESTTACDLETRTRAAWRVLDTGDVDLVVAGTRTLRADPSRLQQVLENLFRNAVEHGSTSPPSHAQEDAVEHGSTSPRSSSTREDAVEHGSAAPDSRPDGGAGDSAVDDAAVDGDDRATDTMDVTDGTDRQSVGADEGEVGGVSTVRVGTLPDGFYVEDDGPGIPSDRREAVFEFGTTSGPGSGFGLAIARTIVEAHGWDIAATAAASGGARFEVHTDS